MLIISVSEGIGEHFHLFRLLCWAQGICHSYSLPSGRFGSSPKKADRIINRYNNNKVNNNKVGKKDKLTYKELCYLPPSESESELFTNSSIISLMRW